VQGIWLYELAELASLGKAEVNLIKAFISSKVDRHRQSYGRVVEAFPRQCVMAGTTNEDTYHMRFASKALSLCQIQQMRSGSMCPCKRAAWSRRRCSAR